MEDDTFVTQERELYCVPEIMDSVQNSFYFCCHDFPLIWTIVGFLFLLSLPEDPRLSP